MDMRIRKKGEEDSEALDVLLSEAITEDIAVWLQGFWLGHPVGFETKADIYNVVIARFKKGIEI